MRGKREETRAQAQRTGREGSSPAPPIILHRVSEWREGPCALSPPRAERGRRKEVVYGWRNVLRELGLGFCCGGRIMDLRRELVVTVTLDKPLAFIVLVC